MKYAKNAAAMLLFVFLMYVLAPRPYMIAIAQSAPSDEGLMQIAARIKDDFEMLLELHEMLEVLSVEERNSTGNTMMTTIQGMQIVQQQVQALSEGRSFLRDAQNRFDFNYAVSSGKGGKFLVGFIHGQRNPPQSVLQIGVAGNGGDHGCGPISVHNTLYSLFAYGVINEVPSIAEIIHRLDMSGGFIMGGTFGTNPEAINQLLRNKGHDANISYMPTNLDEATRHSSASTAILLYIGQAAPGRPAYWHYITVRYVDGRFELYNVGGRDTTYRLVNSVDEWAKNRAVLALITIN